MKNKIVKTLVGILFFVFVGQIVNAGRRKWSLTRRSSSVSPTRSRPRRTSIIQVKAWEGREEDAFDREDLRGDLSSSIDESISSEDSVSSGGKRSLTSEESDFLEAAQKGRFIILKRHITNGRIKVNSCTDLLGRTALHHAAQQGNFPMVDYLMSQGANPFLRDLTGKTALDYARLNGHSAIIWYIQHGYDSLYESKVSKDSDEEN